jgi:hypothetical protein
MTKLIAATTILMLLASAASAEPWAKIEKPCGNHCAPAGQPERGYAAAGYSYGPGPGTFSPSAYPSAPTIITSRSHITIRSYRQ